jgi:hypothetical protein
MACQYAIVVWLAGCDARLLLAALSLAPLSRCLKEYHTFASSMYCDFRCAPMRLLPA